MKFNLLYLILLTACGSLQMRVQTNESSFKWKNLFREDANLAGVQFIQFPDRSDGSPDPAYVDSHPSKVRYFFRDGRVKWFSHEPDGRIIGYGDEYGILDSDSNEWARVDFRFGNRGNPDGRR
ncbi:MAG: hypothetical protein NTV80_04995 [Verrucomicrobia bacterium]|nr:hypothetical protein [Verrucomicrobiota bacterium]